MSLNILVCIKQVPVSNNLKIDPVTKNVIRSNEAGVMNPFDRNAIEEALIITEKFGGTVSLLSMGPNNFTLTLKEGLAMGADKAYLLSSRAFGGADTLATGYVLSEAIKKIGDIDLIFLGKQSVDADTGQVGPIVAEFLNLPQVTFISKLELLENNKFKATRLMDNIIQEVEFSTPAVITVRDELNNPRYIKPRNIKLSDTKEIIVWNEFDLNADPNRIGIKGSPTIVREIWTPVKKSKENTSLGDNVDSAVLNLVKILQDKNIL